MSVNQDVYRQLKDMGIEPSLAKGAAARHSTVDAAIEWCFGAGQSWKPEDDLPGDPPSYTNPGVSVSHQEVFDPSHSAPSSGAPSPHPTPVGARWHPDPPPRHPATSPSKPVSNLSAPFASNNPFRNNPPPPVQDDDDDEELLKALAMSVEEMDTSEGDHRTERERSVRASGVPPPSPDGEEAPGRNVIFGPSEKTDPEGQMSLVPTTPGPTSVSKEEEDMNRAIADSLMTASFHSASASMVDERVRPGPRQSGAPHIIRSEEGNLTYAANVLQGLLAIPQFREALNHCAKTFPNNESHTRRLCTLYRLSKAALDSEDDFENVDEFLRDLTISIPRQLQLPPSDPAATLQQVCINMLEVGLGSACAEADKLLTSEDTHPYVKDRKSLFWTKINMDPPIPNAWYVHLGRVAGVDFELYDALARILWQNDPNASIEEFSDILSVRLLWEYGSPRIPWKFEERVVLDRFLRTNAARSMNIRAQQNVAAGNIRRLNDQMAALTQHKGESTLESLTTLIKHYETSPPSKDPLEKESREEIKAKLEKILSFLQTRQNTLQEDLKTQEEAKSTSAFATDDLELNQHAYILRAVLFHDGAVVKGSRLYVYVRQDDGRWWKIEGHLATMVDFDTIINDRTGLFMDGGPYLLLYSREGPRPEPKKAVLPSDLSGMEQDTNVASQRDANGESSDTQKQAEGDLDM